MFFRDFHDRVQQSIWSNILKLALGSDIHLEFADIDLKNTEGADGLILGGDIMIAEDLDRHAPNNPNNVVIKPGSRIDHAQRYRDFLARCSAEFPWVIYIAGNHEYYHGKWPGHTQVLRDECANYPNIYFLQNDCKTIDDITFIGCTLWTDLNKGDPLTMHFGGTGMTDFQVIRCDAAGYTKLRPAHTFQAHRRSLDYIRVVTEGKIDQKFAVIGHHAPSHMSIHPMYGNDTLMNGMFYSELSEFILDRPQIKLWTHGHTHNNFDYMVGETRIVCNPRGYKGHESIADKFKLQYIDI